MRKVIDVSSFNGTIDWTKAKKGGVEGAIIKIIKKSLDKDTAFDKNQKACEDKGIPWGAYNYSYATTASKAESDMKKVCDILDKCSRKHMSMGVWFDIEDECFFKLSKSAIAYILNSAQKIVESRGYQFGIYTGLAFYKAHIDTSAVRCKNWWIARYYKGYDSMKLSSTPNADYKPLSDIFAWQYTSSGKVDGIDGKVDLNIVYKELTSTKEKESESMTITIGSARIDENGKLTGGKAGDQKQTSSTNDRKGEVSMQDFYVHKKGWVVLRPKSADTANKIAKAMKTACNNKNIGYDQGNRLGVIKYGTATTTKTECDCSSLVRQCVIEASGKSVANFNTENEASVLSATGLVSKLPYSSGMKLYTGDILVTKTKGHTVIVVSGYERTAASTSSGKNGYTGNYPSLPARGYFTIGDGYKVLTDSKNDVKRVQKLINWILDCSLTVDGKYGANTAKMVKKYQKKYGLTADGEFGKNSLATAKTIKK